MEPGFKGSATIQRTQYSTWKVEVAMGEGKTLTLHEGVNKAKCQVVVDFLKDVQGATYQANMTAWLAMLNEPEITPLPDGTGLARDRAYTAVITSKGYVLGMAVKDQPGYYSLEDSYGVFDSYANAQERAETMNVGVGLTPEEANRIVLSSIRLSPR
jgi:hypothetical protein